MQSARSYVEPQHDLMLCTFNPKDFTERLIAAINIAMTYRDDIDQLNDERRQARNDVTLRASSIITNNRHSIATPEDLAWLWNIGIQTAKDTVRESLRKRAYGLRCTQ
jgi:hypothetical protein